MAEEILDLTAEQQAQAEQLSGISIDLTPEQAAQARQLSGQLDPLLDFTPDQLSELEISDPENFNIRREYLNRPELHKGDVLMRAALANQKVRARYDTPSAVIEVSENLPDLLKPAAPVVEKFIAEQIPVVLRPAVRIAGAGKQLLETAKTVTPGKAAKAVWHFASGLAKYAANSIAGAASPFVPEEARQNYRRLAAENLAASEQQITGFFGDIKAGTHKAAQAAGIAKPFSEYDPTEARELFLADLDREILQEETARGKGPVTRQIGGEVIKELESVGKPVRPEEVAKLTDPFTFYAYAKGFGVAGGLVPAEAKAAASSASRWVGEVGRDITGTALEGIGESARILSKGTTALSKIPAQIIPPSVLPPIVLPLIKRAAKVLPDVSEGVKSVGKQIRTGEFVSPSARLIADITETAPAAIGDIAGGIAFDIGTTAAMAEFPEEEVGGGVGIGTAFGLIGAGRHVTRRVISGQEIAPRVWGGKTQIPTSGPFKGSEFDTLHGTAYQTATPAIKQRVNAVREFLKKAAPGVDLFYVPDKAAFETSLINAGLPAADARLWADQSGVFVKDFNGKRVAFATDIDAAPHESFHPFQDVIGETANNILNQKVKAAYTDAEFEREGMRYASRLGWDGRGDWRDFTLDASGEGYHATIEKLAQEAANIIKLSEGKEATPEEAKEQGVRMFNEAFAEATAANPGIDPNIIRRSVWRGILTEAEQKALADNYAANELAAETWDAVFKHTGPGMKDPKGLIPKFARVAGNLVAMMGGEPLAGRESQIGELPLKRAAVDAVREAVRSKIETPPLIAGEAAIPRTPAKPSPSAPARPGAPVGTPEQEATNTSEVAAAAPEQPTGPEIDAQSPREILGTFAESKATGQGVKITRRTAPGTPAGAIEVSRGKRREQIETARGIPDDQKPLWEKNFTPVKTVVLNDGSIQEQGWSPEVLAANAEKTAKFLSDTSPALSPFEIDTAQKTFTADGWRDLFDKVNIFAANQAAGLTGKGTPLVIGRAREFGFFEPTGTREAVGTLTDAEANFINYLFGFPLPGKGSVLKRGGKAQFGKQLITEATEPGRAQPLVEPRTFGSKQAEQLGFAGEQLLEVNPLRAQIEQAGGTPPSLIEVWQNLNLKDIVRADIAPELPAVRPVGVTLGAGFSPKPTKEITERFKSSAPEVKDESGAPKIFYHGSFKMADMIESLKESGFDISKTSNVSLFGPGFYFTSDPNVAGGPYWRNKIRSWFGKEPLGYAFKSTSANDFFPEPFPKFNADAISEMGGTPGIYPAFLDLKNPLNMEKHYPNAELRPILDNILSKSGAGKGYYETIFQGYERDGWGITGQGFYRHLEDLSGAIKKGRSSSSDSGLVNKWLQEAGFDGVAYVGGVRRKGTSLGKHSVMVAFKNEQIVSPYEAEAKGPIKFAPMPANEMAIRSAAVKDETTGRIYESGIHAIAREDAESRGAKGPFTDGFVTNRKLSGNKIEFLNRDESFARAEEINQLPEGQLEMPGGGLESTRFEEVRRFSPMPGNPRAIKRAAIKDEKGKIFEGLFHSDANEKAKAAGSKGPFIDGFVTYSEDFLTRAEAFDRAIEIGQLEKASETAQTRDDLEANLFRQERQFSPSKDRKEIELVGPDGKKYRAMFDGYMDMTLIDLGWVPQITPLENLPGSKVKGSTTYGPSLEKAGYKLPADLPPPTEVDAGEAQFSPKQSKGVSALAEKYAEKAGIDYTTPKGYVQYPRETAKKFAKFYDDAIHSPDDPVVKTSYDAFKRETLDQWNEIVEAGYELEPIISVDSPYRNGADVARDIEANKHLAFNLSESAFRQEGQSENQLMLEPTGINLAGRDLSFNDIFRAVHDFFGHAKQGFSFGPRGEFNAWREHANLYSPEAQGALAAETVGQTAWTQLEPSLLGPTGELLKPGDAGFVKRSERPFAEQKNIVVPEELIAEARGVQFAPRKKKETDPLKFLGTQHGNASKAWILPSGKVEQLGAQWHHDWLSENTEVAAKYKINVPAFEGTDTEGVREGALNKGFARVNLDNGVLVVEVREKNWRNVRPIIEDLIEKNLDDIDRFRVGLLNDTATDLRKTFTAKLFDADNDQAKMERVYEAFSEEARNERGAAFSPKEVTAEEYLQFPFKRSVGHDPTDAKPKYFYHATVSEHLPGIANAGLQTSKEPNWGGLLGKQSEGNVFSADNPGKALFYGEILWRDRLKTDPNHFTPLLRFKEAPKNLKQHEGDPGSWVSEKNIDAPLEVWDGKQWRPLTNDLASNIADGEWGDTPTTFPSKAKFSPKREQFEDPETIREALASPGWAIITGTQEAQGKWNAPTNVEANKALEADLQAQGYEYIPVKGTYKGVPQGSDFLVLDISTYDAQALGKKYKQESVLTPKGLLYGDGTITEGDTANALLGAEARKQEFFSTLPNGLSFSVPLDFSKAPYSPVGEQSTLFGGREYESPANFTQAELRQRHPEAIVPKNSKEKIGSDIVNSPLYKQSENPVNAFADKLVEFTRQYEDNPVYQLGLKWYSDIVPMLKKEFGKDAPMMTELLAASSPNEKPDMNFFYAVDALEGFKSGRFDKIVSKFNEGFDLYKSDKWLSWYSRELKAGNIVNPPKEPTPEAFLANWIYKHDLKPKQSNGQLYGFHGRAILEVLAGKWLQENKGPKVANFVQNLQGTGHEATVDVWLDRSFRRLGYADAKNRWRIMPANGEGVSDADFAFAQKATRAAAERLGILPDALQGGLWFAEKQLWSDNGWGRLDLGSYVVEMKKLPMIRQAIKQRLSSTKQRAKIKPMEELEFDLTPRLRRPDDKVR